MTPLEESNLKTQQKLMSDIIQNYRNINYHVAENGKKLLELLKCRKINEQEKSVTLNVENFDKIFDIVYNLSETERFVNLGILAKTAVPDNETKLKILKMLKG